MIKEKSYDVYIGLIEKVDKLRQLYIEDSRKKATDFNFSIVLIINVKRIIIILRFE